MRVGQVSGGVQFDPADMRSKVAEAERAVDAVAAREKRIADIRSGAVSAVARGQKDEDGTSFGEMLMYVGTAFIIVLAISLGAAWLMMQFYGGK